MGTATQGQWVWGERCGARGRQQVLERFTVALSPEMLLARGSLEVTCASPECPLPSPSALWVQGLSPPLHVLSTLSRFLHFLWSSWCSLSLLGFLTLYLTPPCLHFLPLICTRLLGVFNGHCDTRISHLNSCMCSALGTADRASQQDLHKP